MPISLKEGALFVADAHYRKGVREEFATLLEKFAHNPPPQLFFMGDIFDLLVGKVEATIASNSSMIERIDALGKRCEIYYLEGNHDFWLSSLFSHVKVFPRAVQPLLLEDGKRLLALSHGDNFLGGFYDFYIKALNTKPIITFLNFLNKRGWITSKIERYNLSKNLCHPLENFHLLAKRRASLYRAQCIIEGHYHQRKIYTFQDKTYINLPSYACSKEVMRYSEGEFSFVRM